MITKCFSTDGDDKQNQHFSEIQVDIIRNRVFFSIRKTELNFNFSAHLDRNLVAVNVFDAVDADHRYPD